MHLVMIGAQNPKAGEDPRLHVPLEGSGFRVRVKLGRALKLGHFVFPCWA